jgi:hypothetical protein
VNYPQPFIRLRPSKKIKGEIGAFALKSFKKGQIVVAAADFEDGNTMSIIEYNKLSKDAYELVKAHSTITPDTVFLPKNLNYLRPINYFNHSCDPNIGFDKHDNYVALKNIKRNDEFLLDYSFLNTNPDYKIKCRCASKKCRKIITGNEWRNEIFWKKNNAYFASTLREIKSLSE